MAADLLPPRAIRAPTHRAAQRPQRSQWMQELPIDKPNPDASFASQPSPWAQTDGVVRTLSLTHQENVRIFAANSFFVDLRRQSEYLEVALDSTLIGMLLRQALSRR